MVRPVKSLSHEHRYPGQSYYGRTADSPVRAPFTSQIPKNPAEKAVFDELVEQGYTVLRNGWPDLVAYKTSTGEVRAIEVKTGEDHVRPEQQEMHSFFEHWLGLEVEILRRSSDED